MAEMRSVSTVNAISPPTIEHDLNQLPAQVSVREIGAVQSKPSLQGAIADLQSPGATCRERSLENQKIFETSLSAGQIFPGLPSFNVIAIIFAYVDFDIDVKRLLKRLSR